MDESDRNEGKKFWGKELKRRKKHCGFFFFFSLLYSIRLTCFLFVVADIRYSSMTWVHVYAKSAKMKVIEILLLLLYILITIYNLEEVISYDLKWI